MIRERGWKEERERVWSDVGLTSKRDWKITRNKGWMEIEIQKG
jgi:hypothetical protein